MTGLVTVVIPARNAAATLEQQLSALDRQEGDVQFEVVLVDNGSSDGTADVARSFSSSRFTLRVVDEQRAGVNVARNAGVRAAADGPVLLCDADDVAAPGWVTAMAAGLEPGRWVAGVVDYAMLNSERTRRQWSAPLVSECVVADPFVDRTFGGCCGFWRSMWHELGGFDDRLSGSGDETEFFQRAHAAGYRQQWAPAAVIGYRLRPGLRTMCHQRFRQGRNQVRMSRLAGSPLDGARGSRAGAWRALGKMVLAAPKYLYPAAARYQWLSAMSRQLGRLVGYAARS